MTTCLGRSVKLEIMTPVMVYAFTDLRISFTVELSTDPEPNRATFTIVNLAESTRDALHTGAAAVRFLAGYAGELSQIFSGNLLSIKSQRDSLGWITEIEAMDGHNEIKAAHFDKSFAAGTPLQTIVAAVAASFGIPFELGFVPANSTIMVGTTYSGSTYKVLNDLCDQLNLKWCIQQGTLQVSDKNAPVTSAVAQMVILAPDTGLIGSPVVAVAEDPKVAEPIGSIEAISLLNPLLLPDRPVQISPANPMTFAGVHVSETKKVGAFNVKATGVYRIQRSRFVGCNKDGPFHTEITCPIMSAA